VWQPTFHSDSLAGYAPVMATETRRLVDKLSEVADSGGVTNVWREIGAMTMSVVGSTAFGVDFHLLSEEESNDGTTAAAPRSSSSSSLSSSSLSSSSLGGALASAPPPPASPPTTPTGRRAPTASQQRVQGAALVSAAAEMFHSSEISNATRYLVAAHLMPVLIPVISLLAALFPDERYRRLISARETLRDSSQWLIDATRTAQRGAAHAVVAAAPRASSPASGSGEEGRRPVGVAPGSFLGLLLASRDQEGHGLSDRQMAAQANVFTLAGYEVCVGCGGWWVVGF